MSKAEFYSFDITNRTFVVRDVMFEFYFIYYNYCFNIYMLGENRKENVGSIDGIRPELLYQLDEICIEEFISKVELLLKKQELIL